ARVKAILSGLDQALIVVSHQKDFMEGLVGHTRTLSQGRLVPV
ncbi:MAG: ABC transporter ATP-binding protein, partial [Deltaproteobacteria bacterium]|nr:ABC transporter ATP-binding protein [Deltaproteobacteria bacterium]